MKKLIIIISFLVIFLFDNEISYCQRNYNKRALNTTRYNVAWKRFRNEIHYFIGASNFLGDLGGANQIGTNGLRDFDFPAIRPGGGIGYSYKLTQGISYRTTIIAGYLSGDDKLTKESFRNNRNLNFRTPIIESTAQLVFTMTREREGHRYRLKGVKGWKYINVTSYIFGGSGGFYFNPQGKDNNNKWNNLKPLSTEGQGFVATRKPYALFQPLIVIGLGFRRNISREFAIGLEYGMRKTFTDYVDDVSLTYFDNATLTSSKGDIAGYLADPSLHNPGGGDTNPGQQRGDLSDKDAYMFMFLTLTYKPNNRDFVMWGFGRGKNTNYRRYFR
ncbi:MAG: hypothetical protein A2X12_08800 [Bacteroidetes bacterium GWE2_29_8]|nr:MAG: hypothetical protein A2X12_08800 [Bacteroidetes bacterium GWE2_29_8]OFY18346.1 MAG: hypothetical protein A2X02_08390 [Bacteroidetes bacterium GWF2_29_10]